jgi:hypothetical protein
MTGSAAAAEAPRTLLREPLFFRSAFFITPTLELDQWQMLRVCGVVIFGRPTLGDCRRVRIVTSSQTLIAHQDEVECLDLADG